ncbi:MAG: hypothetical protein R2834_07270 [Rhodothermales bacterium]
MRVRTMLPRSLALAALTFFLLDASAQVRPRAGIDFAVGVPVGDFSDSVGHPGFGISGMGLLQFGSSPAMLGIDLGYLVYGFERRTEPFSTTIPDVRVRVETTNNIALGHLFFRFQPTANRVQPYAQALLGFKYLFTQTSIKDIGSDEDVASSTNFDDIAASYGIGAGVDFVLGSTTSETGHTTSFLLHVGADYLLGGNASYLKRGSIRRENGQVTFDVLESRTDVVLPRIGVDFTF